MEVFGASFYVCRSYKEKLLGWGKGGLSGTPSWAESTKPIDEVIYQLFEGEDTVPHINNIWTVLHQKWECQQLLPIELKTFDGNSSPWPEFAADFKGRVHLKQTTKYRWGDFRTFFETTQSNQLKPSEKVDLLCCCI